MSKRTMQELYDEYHSTILERIEKFGFPFIQERRFNEREYFSIFQNISTDEYFMEEALKRLNFSLAIKKEWSGSRSWLNNQEPCSSNIYILTYNKIKDEAN